MPKRRPPPLRPGWTGLPFLPGSTGVIMETGEAGPPGRMGVSGRGLPRGVDGQTGQRPIPSAEATLLKWYLNQKCITWENIQFSSVAQLCPSKMRC